MIIYDMISEYEIYLDGSFQLDMFFYSVTLPVGSPQISMDDNSNNHTTTDKEDDEFESNCRSSPLIMEGKPLAAV